MLVVRIGPGSSKVCVALADVCGRPVYAWGCAGCGEGIKAYIEVQRVGCPTPAPTPTRQWCGCGYEESDSTETPSSSTVIRYDAFDIDSEGRTCFYLDGKLLTAARGRYDAKLYACGEFVGTFQFHLDSRARLTEIHHQEPREPLRCGA